jgi:hypothetical protein
MKKTWFDYSLHPAFRKSEGSSRRAFLGAAAGLAASVHSEGGGSTASESSERISPPKETGIGPPAPPENWEHRPSARTHPSDEHLVPMMNDAIRDYSKQHGVSPTLLTALWGTENQGSSNRDQTIFVPNNAPAPHYAITTRASDGSPNVGYSEGVAKFFGPYQMGVLAFQDAFKGEFGEKPEKRLRPPIETVEEGLKSDPEMAVDAAARYLNICRKQAEYEAEQLQKIGVIVTPRQITLATIHGYNKGPYYDKDPDQKSVFSFTGRGNWDYPRRAEENFYRLGGTENDFETAFSFGKSFKRSTAVNWFRDTLHPALQKSSFSGIREKVKHEEDRLLRQVHREEIAEDEHGKEHSKDHNIDEHEKKVLSLIEKLKGDDDHGVPKFRRRRSKKLTKSRESVLDRMDEFEEKTEKLIEKEEKKQKEKIRSDHSRPGIPAFVAKLDHDIDKHAKRLEEAVEKLREEEKDEVKEEMDDDVCPDCGCNPCECGDMAKSKKRRRKKRYPSFDVQSSQIARREGVSQKAADAILASRARNHKKSFGEMNVVAQQAKKRAEEKRLADESAIRDRTANTQIPAPPTDIMATLARLKSRAQFMMGGTITPSGAARKQPFPDAVVTRAPRGRRVADPPGFKPAGNQE